MSGQIEEMLKAYNVENIYDRKNAMKEIIQEIVLCGLSKAGFFKTAAFYGETALRIFYGLDRFSEDLDFSLMNADSSFNLPSYFPVLEREVKSFGLNMEVQSREKTRESPVKSAFLKGSTKEHLLLFYGDRKMADTVPGNELIKIKFEIDTEPPLLASFEHRFRLLPSPYEITLYDLPSLFAGKIHAVLCRAWQTRVKGRDLYDYVFYLSKRADVNLGHLRERMIQSGFIQQSSSCTIEDVREMLCKRFDNIDYRQAKEDVLPFIKDPEVLNLWDAEFFRDITRNLTEAKETQK